MTSKKAGYIAPSATIQLGEATITVTPLPMVADKAWREKVESLMKQVLDTAGDLDFANNAALLQSVLRSGNTAWDVFDTMLDLMWEYPQIAEHRDTIEKTLVEREQLYVAFMEVIQLSIPLDRLWEQGRTIWKRITQLSDDGSTSDGTGSNSVSQNGTVGTTNSMTTNAENSP